MPDHDPRTHCPRCGTPRPDEVIAAIDNGCITRPELLLCDPCQRATLPRTRVRSRWERQAQATGGKVCEEAPLGRLFREGER